MNIENITSDDMTLTYNGLTMQKNIYEQEIKRLNNIIDKAIEYIKDNKEGIDCCGEIYIGLGEIEIKELLDILKGSDKK